MKKLESTWYNMAVVLTLIAVIAGASLAGVNAMTKGPIAQIEKEKETKAIAKVLGQEQVAIQNTVTSTSGSLIYVTDCGTAVKSADKNAFGGTLEVLVGFAADGSISGYEVLKSAETPGLGAKAGTWFQAGQKGNIIGKMAGTLKVTKDGGEVDAITASTITSRAFLRCVNAAYAALQETESPVDAETGATAQRH